MTNYTGSTGFGEKFADDIERDVLRGPALEILEAIAEAGRDAIPQIDLTRQAAVGASYGGYLMNWFNGTHQPVQVPGQSRRRGQQRVAVRRERRRPRPRAAHGRAHLGNRQGPVDRPVAPSATPTNWKTPMLVTQGELDYRVPLARAMTTFKLLQRLQGARAFRDLPRRRPLDPQGPEQPAAHGGSDGLAREVFEAWGFLGPSRMPQRLHRIAPQHLERRPESRGAARRARNTARAAAIVTGSVLSR